VEPLIVITVLAWAAAGAATSAVERVAVTRGDCGYGTSNRAPFRVSEYISSS